MEQEIVLTFWPVTVSMTKAGFPYFGSRATNELDHNFKFLISIDFLGMLRWTLREPVIFYKMYCQAGFYKKTVLVGKDGCSEKELSARQKVLAEALCLILSFSQ